jgi:hypothetical protein
MGGIDGGIAGCAEACMGGGIGSCIGSCIAGAMGDGIDGCMGGCSGACIEGCMGGGIDGETIMSGAGTGAGCPCGIAPVLCRSGRTFDAAVANCGSNAATLPASAGNAVRNGSPKG